jgi:3-phenylpropionate/trans-cinnamate dioxygenase alpha subunit
MAMDLGQSLEYVSVERGEVDRRIFSDQEIYDAEMEQIFGRAWLFLCHETQVPKAGDFFEAPMGKDNVLVVRQKDGSLRALLNTCTHRGNAVCRAEEGNTKNFMCTYHGWTFAIDGALIGVPGFENLYHGELDKDSLGLHHVAQIDTYKGFVFATMDASAPPLYDFLGSTGRLGLDLIAERGDMEVLPGIQKFVINCNWKFAVDNLFDWYHPQITHMSAFQIGLFPEPDNNPGKERLIDGGGMAAPDGTELSITAGGLGDPIASRIILGEYGHAIGGPTAEAFALQGYVFDQSWRKKQNAVEALGPVGVNVGGHPNIFPTCWVTNLQISLRVPRDPFTTELWWYTFVDKNATPEQRAEVVFMANHVFGPAGLLEQEDGENWAQSTMQTTGYRSKEVPQALKMDLGRGKIIKEHGLARIDGEINEHAQLWTYAAWAQWMSGADWETLKKNTTPGDYL